MLDQVKEFSYEECLEVAEEYNPDVNYTQVFVNLIKHLEGKNKKWN